MSDFSFQWLLSSLFHPHPSFVHCSEHSKDGHCKDRLSFYGPLLLHWRYRSHLLDDWLYTKQGHLDRLFLTRSVQKRFELHLVLWHLRWQRQSVPPWYRYWQCQSSHLSCLLLDPLQVLRSLWSDRYSPHCGQRGVFLEAIPLEKWTARRQLSHCNANFSHRLQIVLEKGIGQPRNSEAQIERCWQDLSCEGCFHPTS